MDSEPHSITAWVDVLAGYGHSATEADVDACTGLGFELTHRSLSAIAPLPPPGEVWPPLLAALERSFDRGLVVFADAIEVLEAVESAGLPVAVASASPRQRLDLTLRVVGLTDRFGASVAGDEVAASKPDPAVYLAVLKALGQGASEALAIEDTVAGALSAIGAGMNVIAVARQATTREALAATGVRVVDRLVPALLGL